MEPILSIFGIIKDIFEIFTENTIVGIRSLTISLHKTMTVTIPPCIWIYNIYHSVPSYVRIINAFLAVFAIAYATSLPYPSRFSLLAGACVGLTSIYEIYYATRQQSVPSQYPRLFGIAVYIMTCIISVDPPMQLYIICALAPIAWIWGSLHPVSPAIRIGSAILGSMPSIAALALSLGGHLPSATLITTGITLPFIGICIANELYHGSSGNRLLPRNRWTTLLYGAGIVAYAVQLAMLLLPDTPLTEGTKNPILQLSYDNLGHTIEYLMFTIFAAIPAILWIYSAYYNVSRYIRLGNACLALVETAGGVAIAWSKFAWDELPVVALYAYGLVSTIIIATSIHDIYYAITTRSPLSSYKRYILYITGSIAYVIAPLLAHITRYLEETVSILILTPPILWVYARVYPLHPMIRAINVVAGMAPCISAISLLYLPVEIPMTLTYVIYAALTAVGALISNEVYWIISRSNIIPSPTANIILYTIGIGFYSILIYVTNILMIASAFPGDTINNIKDLMEFVGL